MAAVQQGWTDGQILAAFVVLVGFFAVLAGLVAFAAGMLNHLAYWWEDRHTEHDGHADLIDRVDSYTHDEAAA